MTSEYATVPLQTCMFGIDPVCRRLQSLQRSDAATLPPLTARGSIEGNNSRECLAASFH